MRSSQQGMKTKSSFDLLLLRGLSVATDAADSSRRSVGDQPEVSTYSQDGTVLSSLRIEFVVRFLHVKQCSDMMGIPDVCDVVFDR